MIEARHLTKRYGNAVAVDDASFVAQPGRLTGFLAPKWSPEVDHYPHDPGPGHSELRLSPVNGKPYGRLTDPSGRVERCSTPRPSPVAAAPPTISVSGTGTPDSGWDLTSQKRSTPASGNPHPRRRLT